MSMLHASEKCARTSSSQVEAMSEGLISLAHTACPVARRWWVGTEHEQSSYPYVSVSIDKCTRHPENREQIKPVLAVVVFT